MFLLLRMYHECLSTDRLPRYFAMTLKAQIRYIKMLLFFPLLLFSLYISRLKLFVLFCLLYPILYNLPLLWFCLYQGIFSIAPSLLCHILLYLYFRVFPVKTLWLSYPYTDSGNYMYFRSSMPHTLQALAFPLLNSNLLYPA